MVSWLFYDGQKLCLFFARILVAVCCLNLLSSCSSVSGGAEFLNYREAFEESRGASEAIFELLQNSERKQRQIVSANALRGDFDPDAPYLYTDLADPPLTREYRLSFEAVSRYNEVMVGLVTGENAGVVSSDLRKLSADIYSLSVVVAGSTSFGSVAALWPVFETVSSNAFAAQNRLVFSQELARRSDPVIELMVKMRNGSKTIFEFLRANSQNKRSDDEKLLADWVVLMDGNIAALRQAQLAAKNPTLKSSDIIALQARINDIQEAAKSIRKNIGKLAG